jgi:steroid delta-isomerase-like uncharacterized protein
MSKIELATRLVLAFNEAFNRHDVARMMALMSEDCVYEHNAPAPDGTQYLGKESISQFWQDFFRDSPEAHIEIEEIFGLGMHCIMRWRCDWEDEPGKKGHIRGVDIFKLKDGLICEQLSYVKGESPLPVGEGGG